ncbi:unnamed protein product [Colias eurytheme]|nr:unnamed protein product [Colias eurytheme]
MRNNRKLRVRLAHERLLSASRSGGTNIMVIFGKRTCKISGGIILWRALRSSSKARRKRQKNRISMPAVEVEAARREHRAHSARARPTARAVHDAASREHNLPNSKFELSNFEKSSQRPVLG